MLIVLICIGVAAASAAVMALPLTARRMRIRRTVHREARTGIAELEAYLAERRAPLRRHHHRDH